MNRLHHGVTLALAAVVILVATALWRQQGDNRRKRERIERETARVSLLRAQREKEAAQARASSPRNVSTTVKATEQANDSLKAAERAYAALRKTKSERDRRFALNPYIAGFDVLALPPDKLAAAKELILNRGREGAAKPPPSSGAAVIARIKEESAVFAAKMRSLLGAEAAEVLLASSKETGLNRTFGTDFWDAGAPLEPGQVQVFAQEAVRTTFDPHLGTIAETEETRPDPGTGLSTEDTRFLNATEPFLTPAQREILKRSLREENLYRKAMRDFEEKALSKTAARKTL